MTHEPECPAGTSVIDWLDLRRPCICDQLRAAYRRGYNDHARTVQHWQDTHGAYRQHGEGTNP